MSRLDLIRDAQRPKMNARALFQGPQGSGKTWTMLSVARSLTAGTEGRTLVVDTERESALTYADVFTFKHLPWRPPYSPDELTGTLDRLAAEWVQAPDDVVCIDSFSHFWQGQGGILDVAGGRVQGGWDKARPMQQALVEQLLAMPCHLLLGARMKNTVLVSDNGKTIENVGLTIVQDDALGYELNIVVQMDMQHAISVLKSRTPAVPVGRLYPGGTEGKLAADYAEWLAGGIPPANREDVEAIVEVFAGISDAVHRKTLKDAFVAAFGMPHSLTAEQVPVARGWLAEQGAPIGQGPAANDQPLSGPVSPEGDSGLADAPEAATGAQGGLSAAASAAAASGLYVAGWHALIGSGVPRYREVTEPAPPCLADPDDVPDLATLAVAVRTEVEALDKPALVGALRAAELGTAGTLPVLRQRLVDHRLQVGWQPPQQALV